MRHLKHLSMAFLLCVLITNANADSLSDKAANKILGGCDTDLVLGNCIVRAYAIYKAAKLAKVSTDIARMKLKKEDRDKALAKKRVAKTKALIKKAWKYNPANVVRKGALSAIGK